MYKMLHHCKDHCLCWFYRKTDTTDRAEGRAALKHGGIRADNYISESSLHTLFSTVVLHHLHAHIPNRLFLCDCRGTLSCSYALLIVLKLMKSSITVKVISMGLKLIKAFLDTSPKLPLWECREMPYISGHCLCHKCGSYTGKNRVWIGSSGNQNSSLNLAFKNGN